MTTLRSTAPAGHRGPARAGGRSLDARDVGRLCAGAAWLALGCVGLAVAAPPPPGGFRPMPPVAGVPPPARAPGWGGGYYGPRYGWPGGWYGNWYGGYWGPRVGVYLGSPWYGGAWPYPAYGYGWGAPYVWGAPYAYYYYGTPVVVGSTTIVPQEAWTPTTPSAAQPAAPAPSSYWYYCPQPQGYFPYVKDCAQGWLKVVPQAPGESNTPPSLAP